MQTNANPVMPDTATASLNKSLQVPTQAPLHPAARQLPIYTAAEFKYPAQLPRGNRVVCKFIGRTVMKIIGWRVAGALPDCPKMVITIAPHTTNWDFPIGVMVMWALDLRLTFAGKHSLFFWPFSVWLKAIGGIPVDRRAANGLVGALVNEFAARDKLIYALSPEGTRTLTAGFRSGFLHVARQANVPIVLGYFDYEQRLIAFDQTYIPSGAAPEQVAFDLEQMVTFYRPIQGKYRKQWQH
jgi:hypothetical protein